MVGGVETQNRLAQHPHVVVENLEGYLNSRGLLLKVRGLSPMLIPQLKTPVLGKRTPHIIWPWKSGGFHPPRWDGRLLETQVSLKEHANTSLQVLTLGFNERTMAWGHQRHRGRNWVVWLRGKGWRDSYQLPSVEPSSPMSQRDHLF